MAENMEGGEVGLRYEDPPWLQILEYHSNSSLRQVLYGWQIFVGIDGPNRDDEI